jgi:type IV pilus assembly protein PilO
MDFTQLRELDLNSVGEWPGIAKAGLVLILCCGLAGGGYYLYTQHQFERLASARRDETALRERLEAKQRKAANLDAYRRQLAEMRASFGAMLRQLPDRTEVASLLVDVSQTGLAAGLEFELFRPAAEEVKDFYAELPIQIRVTGVYHDFGHFVSGLAALPRIVTVHDVTIEPKDNPGQSRPPHPLEMSATVKTYRYIDEEAQP